MEEIKHIPKREMEDGAYYVGWCRNTCVAKWDGEQKNFIHIGYSFGFNLDRIEHFDDVAKKHTDGFVPFEKIENPKKDRRYHEYVKKIGY